MNWALDDLMESQKIFGKGFEGGGEINDGGITSVLPVYKMVYTNSRPIELCFTYVNGIQNKLGSVNYVIFKPEVAGYFKVKVNSGQNHDHDLSIIKSGNEIAVYNNSNN